MSCQVQLFLPESHSLKEKRQIVSSLKGRIHTRFEVAIAEVDHHELWQRSALGIAVVSTAVQHAEDVLNHAIRFIQQDLRVQVLDFFIERH